MIRSTISIFCILSLMSFAVSGNSMIPGSDAQIESAISGSDDYDQHKAIFISATKKLVKSGKCTISELKNMGGWVKSQDKKKESLYFTYCGGMKISNKIYLDVSAGKISQ